MSPKSIPALLLVVALFLFTSNNLIAQKDIQERITLQVMVDIIQAAGEVHTKEGIIDMRVQIIITADISVKK